MEDKKSKQDPSHITQMTFDEDSWAVRTKLVDTEMNMELSAEDGDSVISQPAKFMASAMECTAEDKDKDVIPPMPCANLREIHVSTEGTAGVSVLVSPQDSGDFFYAIGGSDAILKICARRIKVKLLSGEGNVHLVGRS